MEAFDKDGNPVEGLMSAEEVQAKLDAEKAEWEKANPPAPVAPAPEPKNNDEMPDWAKDLKNAVDGLKTNNTQTFLGRVTTGLDADRAKEVEAKFSTLTGYDETVQGLQRRAEDAYLLATGEKFNDSAVNMGNIVMNGGKTNFKPEGVNTEQDKAIQNVLGIAPADVEKFTKK